MPQQKRAATHNTSAPGFSQAADPFAGSRLDDDDDA
jgi:hypothetical protein